MAFFLSVLILFIYTWLINQSLPPENSQKQKPQTPIHIEKPTIKYPTKTYKTIETELLRVDFGEGATINSVRLKKYREKGTNSFVELSGLGSLQLEGLGGLQCIDTSYTDNSIQSTFVCTNHPQLKLIKSVTIKNYILDTHIELINESTSSHFINDAQALYLKWHAPKNGSHDIEQVCWLVDGDYKKASSKNRGQAAGECLAWAAQKSHYFTTAIVPTVDYFRKVEYTPDTISIAAARMVIPPSGTLSIPCKIYAGPLEYNQLHNVHSTLTKLSNIGVLERAIVFLLDLFYSYTKNYGIAIILLTLLIKIALHPLSIKMYKSIKRMQELQPQLQLIKERYKNDKEALQREIFSLYRKHKLNPFSGCFPLLLQLPIFIALYNTLRYAIALRDAPFCLWIQDLSVRDPLCILPLLMGLTMYIQQTATSVDAQQKRIGLFMTIFFTIICLNFPAGLVLYWLVQNVVSIIEQKFVVKI